MSITSAPKMNLVTAVIISINAMIGASIFLIPERLHQNVGPAALITYAFVIAAVWCMATSLAKVAGYYQEEGSFFTYVSKWGGPNLGLFVTGLYVGGIIVAMGLLTRVAATYLNSLIDVASISTLSTAIIWVLSATIFAGTRMASWSQYVLIAFTLAPLFIITLLCLSKARIANIIPFMPHGPTAIFKSAKYVIFGFFGFEATTALYSSVEKPEKNVPRAITLAIIFTSLLYVVFVFSTFLGLPSSLFVEGNTLPQVLNATFPAYPWLIKMVQWGIIITILGTLHAVMWSLSSLIKTLAEKVFHKNLPFGQSLLAITLAMWLCSTVLTNIDLFFSIASLCIILALSITIWPLAVGIIPAKMIDRVIAILGLFTAGIMSYYAMF